MIIELKPEICDMGSSQGFLPHNLVKDMLLLQTPQIGYFGYYPKQDLKNNYSKGLFLLNRVKIEQSEKKPRIPIRLVILFMFEL